MGFTSRRRTQAHRKGAERKLVRDSCSCRATQLRASVAGGAFYTAAIAGGVCLNVGALVHTVARARPFCGCLSKAKAYESPMSRLQRIARWVGALQSLRHLGQSTKATRARLCSIESATDSRVEFSVADEHNCCCAPLCSCVQMKAFLAIFISCSNPKGKRRN